MPITRPKYPSFRVYIDRTGVPQLIRRTRLQWVLKPRSGNIRVPTCEPCEVRAAETLRHGTVWNLSALGVYLALDGALPSLGQELDLTFSLANAAPPIVCRARVAWKNPPSLIITGLGAASIALPPGCGVAFLKLTDADRARIEEWMKAHADKR
jgi:hypothetical protein